MDIEEIDHQLRHWRVALRAARFECNEGNIAEAELALDDLLEKRHDLESHQADNVRVDAHQGSARAGEGA